MREQTYQVRMQNGVIGDVTTTLKANELLHRFAMCLYTVDGEVRKAYGTVAYIYDGDLNGE